MEKGTYNINQTHSQNLHAFNSADCETMRDSCAAIMADQDHREIGRTRRRPFHDSLKSRYEHRTNSKFVVLCDWCTGAVAGEVGYEEWCRGW